MGRLDGKVTLITGGALGLGEAMARMMAREGAKIAVADLKETEGRTVADAIGGLFVRLDVSKEDEWQNAIDETCRKFGRLDVLVNNAGVGGGCPPEEQTLERWRWLMSINLDGVFLGTKHAILAMKRKTPPGGSIINLSSIEGLVGDPNLGAYNASKGGVRLYTKSVALYCAKAGLNIRVNSIHPGYIWTPMVENYLAEQGNSKKVERLWMRCTRSGTSAIRTTWPTGRFTWPPTSRSSSPERNSSSTAATRLSEATHWQAFSCKLSAAADFPMREAMGDPMLGPEQSMDCDPWKTNAADWPADGSPDEKLIFLLNYAVLAPSILNTQPWRFRLADGLLRLEEDTSRRMMVVDRDGRESTISCGAALTNLLVAARSFGHDLEIKIAAEAPSTDTLATIRLGDRQRRPSDADRRLREAIRIRRTVRLGFEPKPVDPAILQEFASLARQFNVQVASIVEFERKRTVAQLVGEAEKIHLKDPEFREEIRHWLQLRRSEDHESLREFYVRMGSASGHSPQSGPRLGQGTLTGADIARTFATPEAASERQYALAESSPVLLVLATAGDSRSDWLSAGQALQRMLLAAAVGGLSASYLNPPIEIPQLRDEIAKAFDIDFKPQVLFRLGYGESISPTPRRPIGEVLTRRVSAP